MSVIPVLSVKDLTINYDNFPAVDNISFDVQEGDCLGIVGPNGAGKTTLMRAVSGLIPVKSGTLDMEGINLINTPSHDIVKLGILLENHTKILPETHLQVISANSEDKVDLDLDHNTTLIDVQINPS